MSYRPVIGACVMVVFSLAAGCSGNLEEQETSTAEEDARGTARIQPPTATGKSREDAEETSAGTSERKTNSDPKEKFIKAFMDARKDYSGEALSKLVYESDKYPSLVGGLWLADELMHFNKKVKTISIVDIVEPEAELKPDKWPLPVAARLKVVYEIDQNVITPHRLAHQTGTIEVTTPLGFKDGAYYFMMPESLLSE